MKYLLDSSIVAAALKGRLPVVLKLSALKPGEVGVAAVSRIETEGSLRAQPRAQARFGKLLRDFYGAVQVLDFGAAETQHAVNLAAFLQQSGESMSAFDLQVAATALARQLTVVTDRPQAFAGVPNLDVVVWN